MADQLRWFKVWTSAATDADLQALSLDDFARWVLFGLYMREHGDKGQVTLRKPAREVARRLRCSSWDSLMKALSRFPNTRLRRNAHRNGQATPPTLGQGSADPRPTLGGPSADPPSSTSSESSESDEIKTLCDAEAVTVTILKWAKYQEDTSWERMRRYRDAKKAERNGDRNDARNEVTVQTRRDETVTPIPPSGTPSPTSPADPPPEAFNHDCPVETKPDGRRVTTWPGRCVSAEYFDAHPEAGLGVRGKDDEGRLRPKQCPHHRAEDERPW